MLKYLQVAIVLLPFVASAQIEGFEYEFEQPVQVGGTVLIKWTLIIGSTCNGTDIERSTDSINYEVIGNIAGECGSPNFNVPYDFTDESPIPNKRNYYRFAFNRVGYSEPRGVFVAILNDDGTLIIPNPLRENATIHFSNYSRLSLEFRLYDYNGKMVRQEINVTDTWLKFNRKGLPQGAYLFQLMKNNEVRSFGRLVILD